jgi:anti-anti-sigma regulatory factor
MAAPLQTKVSRSDGRTFVELSGLINEMSRVALDQAFSDLERQVVISFRGVTRINSYGVKLLVELLARVSLEHSLEFVECSETVVDQFLLVDFGRYGRFKSFVLRYDCESCGGEQGRLVDVDRDIRRDGRHRVTAPSFACKCGGTLFTQDSIDFLLDQLERE